MGKKSGPPPPDYTQLAEKTAASSNDQLLNQTYANRMTQTNPWGTVSYASQAAKNPDGSAVLDSQGKPVMAWTQNTQLNPEQQHALDQQMSMQSGRSDIAQSLMGQVRQQMQNGPLDFSGFTPLSQGAQAQQVNATTNPYGMGVARQNINTGLQGTPNLKTSLDYAGLQDVKGSGYSRDQAYNDLYKQATSRLDPQWQQRQDQLESQLANQGITRGSAAFDQAMTQLGTQRNDAYNQAMMSAQSGAVGQASQLNAMDLALRQQQAQEAGNQGNFYNTAQGQMFGFGSQDRQNQLQAQNAAFQQSLAGGQFDLARQQQGFQQQMGAGAQNFGQQQAAAQYQNTLRQQQIAEANQQQNWSLNALNALLNGQQVSGPQFANFSQAGMGQGVDYSGAGKNQFDAGMQQQQMQNQATGQMLQAAGGMGSMFLMSDRRVKTDIRRIARHPRGFGIYRYRFIGESRPRIGVMAQDVARVMPEAVASMRGVLHVNYAALS
jgi:hypothetical protein